MFHDTHGRAIDIQETELGCVAFHQGQQVAQARLKYIRNAPTAPGVSKRIWHLEHIEVAKQYRCCGIATEMFFLLKSWFQPLVIPDLPEELEKETDWSADVLGWLLRLKRKGLILRQWPTEHDTVQRLRHNRSLFDR